MEQQTWVLCPVCNNKTRTKILKTTETLINIKYGKVTIIKEPDAKTQSR